MIETLMALSALYGLVIFIQTFRKYRQMQEINKNGQTIAGRVTQTGMMRNMLAGPIGSGYHTVIVYQLPGKQEPLEIHLSEQNMWTGQKYARGEVVDVVYDSTAPYHAYPKPEWQRVSGEFWKAGLMAALTVALGVARWLLYR